MWGEMKRKSEGFQLMNKLINANDIHRGERNGLQHIEVMVFCHDISGISHYGTIL